MTPLSGITPIANQADYAAMLQLLDELERTLPEVTTPELRTDLLDIAAMYRAAIDGYDAVRSDR